MPRFKFKLEKVLQHRKIQEELARKDFEESARELRSREAVLEKYQLEVVNARDEAFRLQSAGGAPTLALMSIDDFLKGQEIRIQRQKNSIQEQLVVVENQRDILRQKAIEYKIMEELKEKKLQEFKIELDQKEQKEIDEINTQRFQRESS